LDHLFHDPVAHAGGDQVQRLYDRDPAGVERAQGPREAGDGQALNQWSHQRRLQQEAVLEEFSGSARDEAPKQPEPDPSSEQQGWPPGSKEVGQGHHDLGRGGQLGVESGVDLFELLDSEGEDEPPRGQRNGDHGGGVDQGALDLAPQVLGVFEVLGQLHQDAGQLSRGLAGPNHRAVEP